MYIYIYSTGIIIYSIDIKLLSKFIRVRLDWIINAMLHPWKVYALPVY